MHRRKKQIIIPFAVLLGVLGITLLSLRFFKDYTTNEESRETDMLVPGVFSLYSGDNLGYSFLYPTECAVTWEAGDSSACIYSTQEDNAYVLVCRSNKGNMSPKSYFKKCNKMMVDSFAKVESTPIQEVNVAGKTLYLTRYVVEKGGEKLTIDRYVELYRGFYIQYTAISPQAGSLDTIVYYAITTLRTAEGAYVGAFSQNTQELNLTDINARISLPVMLETQQLTIGTFSSGENAVMLCVLCQQDHEGKTIYNRQDFIDRAAADPAFVSGYLGADSASFTEGQERNINGRSFYCYPMEMSTDGKSFHGELCIANAEETGVYLLCWAVRDQSPFQEKVAELCAFCANTLKIG